MKLAKVSIVFSSSSCGSPSIRRKLQEDEENTAANRDVRRALTEAGFVPGDDAVVLDSESYIKLLESAGEISVNRSGIDEA